MENLVLTKIFNNSGGKLTKSFILQYNEKRIFSKIQYTLCICGKVSVRIRLHSHLKFNQNNLKTPNL